MAIRISGGGVVGLVGGRCGKMNPNSVSKQRGRQAGRERRTNSVRTRRRRWRCEAERWRREGDAGDGDSRLLTICIYLLLPTVKLVELVS